MIVRYTKKLFDQKDIYNTKDSESVFVQAIKENASFHYRNCSDYKRILNDFDFNPESIPW